MHTKAVTVGAISWASPLMAIELALGPMAGVMTQPTSSYLHAAAGLTLDLQSSERRIIGRAIGFARPRFESAGYADQDTGWGGLIGTRIAGSETLGILSFLGAARMQGYVEDARGSRSAFGQSGPAFGAEAFARWSQLEISITHHAIAGYANEVQSRAFVAWPFTFSAVRCAVHL